MKNNYYNAKFIINNVLLTMMLTLVSDSSAGAFNDCRKDRRNDTKIRIGFLSRYKSSKVSLKNGALCQTIDVSARCYNVVIITAYLCCSSTAHASVPL